MFLDIVKHYSLPSLTTRTESKW